MDDVTTIPDGVPKGADLDNTVCQEESTSPVQGGRPTYIVDGDVFIKMPVNATVEQHVRALRKMTVRPNDVLIAGFSKSGTHWIWEVVHMLISGKVEYEPRAKEHFTLEFTDVEKIDALESPRILSSHLLLRHLSTEIVEKRIPVIHMLRNPKDIMVSWYHHRRQTKTFEGFEFDEFVEQFLNGGILAGSHRNFFNYLAEMEKWQQDHPDFPVLNVYFEDVKKHPVESVKNIARFLGVEASEAKCADVADACSFQKLKLADETKDMPMKHLFVNGKPQLYRKGDVGDWKNHFTVALNEKVDAVLEEKLKNCSFKFQYTI